MKSLEKSLRTQLEHAVRDARDVSEAAARAALEQLGVGEAVAFSHLSESEGELRHKLRVHGRHLGDALNGGRVQTIDRLTEEVAYEHWHRMLFARFLADNDLLMYDGVAITVAECDELAEEEGAKSGWQLAGKLAARMLPQVFKAGSPVFSLTFAPEHQSELERLLIDLPDEVFKASDSLGWVYQFWQADNKERINKSEVKIGADELPAVTQLFTEPYMVAFLLHNSLGAWWATRHPDTPSPVDFTYLRTLEDGSPAAGKFECWPKDAKTGLADFKLLDPCCGSGHFLVAAFLMLVPMRMAAEGLSAKDAVDRVLADNLHGLELDPRCVEIAVFAVALEAWRYPDASGKSLGVREIPAPNIAGCGLKVAAKAKDWEALVPDDAPNCDRLRQGLSRLHETFAQAPLLGSLLNPSKANKGDLFAADYRMLTDLLSEALATERRPTLFSEEDERWELALRAHGLLEAARLLDAHYHLVITNVPYLARNRQEGRLKDYCESHYPDAKNDLANVFLERCLELCNDSGVGVVQIVMPQNWLFLGSYKKQREHLLREETWNLLARLGPGAFETISGEVVQAILLTLTRAQPAEDACLHGVDASAPRTAQEKAELLRIEEVQSASQKGQLGNPDARVVLSSSEVESYLAKYASGLAGILNGDSPRFLKLFWEIADRQGLWSFQQTTQEQSSLFGGLHNTVYFDELGGHLREEEWIRKERLHNSDQRGQAAVGKKGIAVSSMGKLPVSMFSGSRFDSNVAVILPKDKSHLLAIWCFCLSQGYNEAVRLVDQALKVTNSTLVKIPFDLAHWQQVANDCYPDGLPQPYSDDPTQWIFHGHPQPSTDPLQVAVARLLGYTWPAETDDKMELSDEARDWIGRGHTLASYADKDGIVCIPPVGRESSASDRLLNLLAAAYGEAWSHDSLSQLLTASDHEGKSLETWLREKFFTQHCQLFHQRPFIWHIWDGLRDGFAALVNYHKLDYKNLETLIYTYIGDWITRQKQDIVGGVDGAQEKLAAAEQLKKRLEVILEGEAPYDIFVRWKAIEKQPIGWNPDLNDGARLNIRPFLSVPDVGKRGAGVLRDKPNIKWEKDRGKDVESAPWYHVFNGDRINDHHLTIAEKRKARVT